MGYYAFNCGLIGTGKKSRTGVYDIEKAQFTPKSLLVQNKLTYNWWATGTNSNPTNQTGFDAFFTGTSDGTGEHTTNIYWNQNTNKPSYLPSNQFAWQVEGFIRIDTAGFYCCWSPNN